MFIYSDVGGGRCGREAVFYTVDSIEDAIVRKKKIAFNYFHLNEKAKRVYVTTPTRRKKRYYIEPER